MKKLLALGFAEYLNDRDQRGYLPLHSAMIKGHAEMVAFLLDCGAKVESRYLRYSGHARTSGYFPHTIEPTLQIAISSEQYDMIPSILKKDPPGRNSEML